MGKDVNKKRYDRLNNINFSLFNIEVDQLSTIVTPTELAMLLLGEIYSEDVMIMLDNMLEYFEDTEEYEYCKVVYDEICYRNDLSLFR